MKIYFLGKLMFILGMATVTKFSFDTELSADTVEWCPTEDYTNFFAVGTYQVDSDKEATTFNDSQRHGKLYLFEEQEEAIKVNTVLKAYSE